MNGQSQPPTNVFSACAEVVPVTDLGEALKMGILRVRGGSSRHTLRFC